MKLELSPADGIRGALIAVPMMVLAACASTPPPQSGQLTSYSTLTPSKAMRTRASVAVDLSSLATAKTLKLAPVSFVDGVGDRATPAQLALIANSMQRKLCTRLSQKYDIVGPTEPADLTLKTVVTRIKSTQGGVSAVSIVISKVSPVPFTPRVPLGLGGFSAEGEATDVSGHQAAAMIWSRDADAFTKPRVSSIGDAYDLSGAFAQDMSSLLITGKDPVHDVSIPKLPQIGNKANANCAPYGKGGGVAGFIGTRLGAPPEWTDGQGPPPSAAR